MGGTASLPPWLLDMLGGDSEAQDPDSAYTADAANSPGGWGPRRPPIATPPFVDPRSVLPPAVPAPDLEPHGIIPPKSGFGGFLSKLAPALDAGITAAATPRTAYGGPVDIFRGLQAAGDQARNKALQTYSVNRQANQDEMNRQKTQAEIDRMRAEQAMYGQHGAYWDARARVATPPDPHRGMVQVNPKDAPQFHVDKNGELWLPAPVAAVIQRQTVTPNVKQNYEEYLVEQLKNATDPMAAAQIQNELKAIRDRAQPRPASTIESAILEAYHRGDMKTVRDLQRIDPKKFEWAPERPPKPATRGQFAAVESRKANRLLAAEHEADKAVAKLGDDGDPSSIYQDLEDKKAQIQSDYENEISVLDPNFVPNANPAAQARGGPPPAPAPGVPAAAPAVPPVRAVPQATKIGAKPPAQPKPVKVPFHKENLPSFVQKNNAVRQARGLPALTVEQTQRALEAQNYEVR